MGIPEYYALLPASSKRELIRVDVLVKQSNLTDDQVAKAIQGSVPCLAGQPVSVCGVNWPAKQQPLLSSFQEESSF